MTVPIRTIKFWINAFIPRIVPGYTLTVSAGPHTGKTMIPGPQSLRVPTIRPTSPMYPPRIGSTRVGVSDCYLTDQRSFSNGIHAKSRMHSEFTLHVGEGRPRITQWHNCDHTTECDCEDGEVECHEKGDSSRMRFALLPARLCGPDVPVRVSMSCSANNPCAPTSRLFGDIDYEGVIEINSVSRCITFNGLIDQFPAFEAYATINDGAGTTMFRLSPPTL